MSELSKLLKELNWSQRKLARVADVSVNSVNLWATGKVKTPTIYLIHLKLLVDIKKAVGE